MFRKLKMALDLNRGSGPMFETPPISDPAQQVGQPEPARDGSGLPSISENDACRIEAGIEFKAMTSG